MTRKLALVPKNQEPPKDITLALRADINKRDWGAMHISADKRRPFERLRWVGV